MDLEEWELLPDEGFLEINDDGGKKFFSRKYPKASSTTSDFQMNYFICPPKQRLGHPTLLKNQLLPLPIDLETNSLKPQDEEVDEKEAAIKIIPVESTDMMMPTEAAPEKVKAHFSSGPPGADQDQAVSQVFFKKMKETEFADMKVESPKSGTTSSGSRGIMPQIEGAGIFQFEEKGGDPCNKEAKVVEPEMEMEVDMKKDKNMELEESDEGGIINIWKWSLTGIGAICSFGVAAAATVCIIILSKNKYADGKLQFQIYTDDKRMKQVVGRASKINEAIRGVPITRARITYGGYYDASL